MPSQTVLEFASHTDTGLVRSHNEDAIAICPDESLAILADGMGGYNAGEVASQMSVDIVARQIKQMRGSTWFPHMPWQTSVPMKWIRDAVTMANTQVIDQANQNPDNFGMGTTIVVALCYLDRLVIGHVGDSRAYRFRDNNLELITHDHSVLQSQIDAGLITPAEAQFSPIKNLITRAVGSSDDIDVEVHDHAMQANDVYMLCSDGLTDMLDHIQIQLVLRELGNDLDTCCKTLVYLANRQGGLDNISVVLFRVKELHERRFMEYIFAS
ncbi:Stp1/IreP family PP2C-type Ser/Thr phosphatase [Undibacterium sp. LX40W]|uniref:Stp1/IreP family PP2C-type Ser/Thr phosphatase n=1 Tax=Undibacterium nitidum TaxID=2762298 RepID=A0A923HM12_9BURK|nr:MULTISPECIES: Stp1/IreP family PP2C-type Ser/Thr phosphatase [Undibacterium]MBC3880843.1 Stp1/IreP family PP2C-type Ser/Thr phosphatase [Undibacterium nitidum]MBC3890424.1 Stp1/IreP family PP2C-type Ser/Thr phosphatase [Undibacterium sp. LX40W]